MGPILFLATALLLLLAGLTALLLYEMTHPPRHTAGYALARGLPSDPGELGFEFDQCWLEQQDGARLPVWEIDTTASPADQSTTKPEGNQTPLPPLTVVFVHGWGHSRIDMLHHVPRWRGRCQRMIFYDLRGHGETERANSQLGWNEHKDLIALLEQLEDGPFLLVGFSMGAVIALSAAASDHPVSRRLAGVVAYAPYVHFSESLRARLHRHHLPATPMVGLAVLIRRIIGRAPRDLGEELANVACPVLIIAGEADIIAPLKHAEHVADRIPHAERHEVPGATHRDVHQLAGEGHEVLVDAFIERIASASSASAPNQADDASPAG